jgi:large subunit ribosomal protein L25
LLDAREKGEEKMKLSYFSRTTGKKGEVNKLRREGSIPAVLYGLNQSAQPIFVKKNEVETFLRNMKAGLLSTAVFELNDGQKTRKAMIKEVQYHRSTYAILHIDFALVDDKAMVTVNVPVQITGVAECAGVKSGGFVRQSIRSLKVSCLLKDIPQELSLDVRDMEIAHTKRLSDIAIPAGVKPIAKMNEVAVVIAKKV